ncbi:MAG: hypothetical protein WC383_11655 [Gammaproteobacteria bacterium]
MDSMAFETEMQQLIGRLKTLPIATVRRLHQALLAIRGDVEGVDPADAHALVMAVVHEMAPELVVEETGVSVAPISNEGTSDAGAREGENDA